MWYVASVGEVDQKLKISWPPTINLVLYFGLKTVKSMQIFENIFSLPLGIFQTNRTYSKPLPKFVNLAGGGLLW